MWPHSQLFSLKRFIPHLEQERRGIRSFRAHGRVMDEFHRGAGGLRQADGPELKSLFRPVFAEEGRDFIRSSWLFRA